MAKRNSKPDIIDNRKHTAMLIISLILCSFALCFVLYYLFVVVASGDSVNSSILTELTDVISEIFKLFIDAHG